MNENLDASESDAAKTDGSIPSVFFWMSLSKCESCLQNGKVGLQSSYMTVC